MFSAKFEVKHFRRERERERERETGTFSHVFIFITKTLKFFVSDLNLI